MKLYTAPYAPNPTKVALYLAEREDNGSPIELEQIQINLLSGEQRDPRHLARNPFGTLPVLELEDGRHLIESLSIIDYFEARFPIGALLPQDLEKRAFARDLERIIECRLGFALFDFVHAVRSPLGHAPDPTRAAIAIEQLETPLDHIEFTLSDGRQFLTGENVSTADISLAAYLNFVRLTQQDILGDRTHLRNWRRAYVRRPAARRVFAI